MFPSYSVDPIPLRMKNFFVTASNIIIQRIKCIPVLGLLIDERLDWQEHINSCKNKLTNSLYAINIVNIFFPVSAVKTFFYTLVYPYLTYVIILWGSRYNDIPFYKSIHYTKENRLFHAEKKLYGTFPRPFYMPSLIKIA